MDQCCTNSHVNATVWYSNFTQTGAYFGLEAGYWRDRGQTYINGHVINQCFYAGILDTAERFFPDCLVYAGADPGASSFWIQARSPGSTLYDVYIGGNYQRTYNVGVTGSHRLDTGYDEQADSLANGPSFNGSRPLISIPSFTKTPRVTGTIGVSTPIAWWTTLDLNPSRRAQEDSPVRTVPLSGMVPALCGCDGSAPTSPRSDW